MLTQFAIFGEGTAVGYGEGWFLSFFGHKKNFLFNDFETIVRINFTGPNFSLEAEARPYGVRASFGLF